MHQPNATYTSKSVQDVASNQEIPEYFLRGIILENTIDEIFQAAFQEFETAFVRIKLTEVDRQLSKSGDKLDAALSSHCANLCQHALAEDRVFVVFDVDQYTHFEKSPEPKSGPYTCLFAGVRLELPSGRRIGSLSVFDPAPRDQSCHGIEEKLNAVASRIASLLESRRCRQEQLLLHLVTDSTTEAVICSDAKSKITFWNRGAEMLFGWSACEAIGQSLDIVIPERYRQAHHAGVARLRKHNTSALVGRTVEVTASCKAGHEIPVDLSLSMWPALEDTAAGLDGFAAIIRDVSARKRALEHHKVTEAHLARLVAAIEESDDGIAITDPDGVFIFMNHAHARMFDYEDPSDLIGQPWSILYGPLEAERIRTEGMPILSSEGRWRSETQGRTRLGMPIEQEVVLSLSHEGGIVCVTRNIGERRALEREKIRLREQLMLAQRQEVVGQLASGIAHDFNNLLAAISGTAELLHKVDDARVQLHAARIQSATLTASELVNKLLTLGRRIPNPKYVGLRDLFQHVRDLVSPSLTDPLHHMELVLPEDPLLVLADETELQQVVLNLVLNARDALPPDKAGKIILEATDDPEFVSSGNVVIGAIPVERSAVIRISDTGCGIATDDLAQVFEPFFTHKGEAGTGLGLSVVAGIIANNNAALAVQSHRDVGTVFEVWWPLKPPVDSEQVAPKHLTTQSNTLSGKSVMVIDDNAAVADTLTAMLEDIGAEVAQCINPHDAIEAIKSTPDAWDIIITDFDMPGMNGKELAHEIRSIRNNLPILLITAWPRLGNIRQNEIDLFDGFLQKPAGITEIVTRAAAAIDAARTRD